MRSAQASPHSIASSSNNSRRCLTRRPAGRFRGQSVRFVFRATRLYGAVLVFALRPAHLHDGADFSLAFELLARALLTAADRPASWPILGAERWCWPS